MGILWECPFIMPLEHSHINLTEIYWILAAIVSHSEKDCLSHLSNILVIDFKFYLGTIWVNISDYSLPNYRLPEIKFIASKGLYVK